MILVVHDSIGIPTGNFGKLRKWKNRVSVPLCMYMEYNVLLFTSSSMLPNVHLSNNPPVPLSSSFFRRSVQRRKSCKCFCKRGTICYCSPSPCRLRTWRKASCPGPAEGCARYSAGCVLFPSSDSSSHWCSPRPYREARKHRSIFYCRPPYRLCTWRIFQCRGSPGISS